MSEGLQAAGAAVAVGWPRPLPVLLAPAPDEALSSWMARHATFFGVGRTGLLRHCLPDVPSLHLLNRALTPEQEVRLAHLFRLGRPALRRMTHAELGSEAIGLLVAHDVNHWCEPCAHSLAEAGFGKAILRTWFHTWRITCPQCGSRVSPSWRTAASLGANRALPDLFPHLWAKALDGERLLDAALHRAETAVPLIPPMRLMRLLMIQAGCERLPADGERQGWTLDAVVPGFNAALEQHGVTMERTTLVQRAAAVPHRPARRLRARHRGPGHGDPGHVGRNVRHAPCQLPLRAHRLARRAAVPSTARCGRTSPILWPRLLSLRLAANLIPNSF